MKKAIVIGASSGIGRELSKILSTNQYRVGIMARRIHLLNELRDEMNTDVFVREIDVSVSESAMEMFAKFIEDMGGVELVVISAGTGDINEGTRYEDIVRVFGGPQFNTSLDGKIKAEWVGRINGLVFTIYDYKSRLDPERNTDWHIGGKQKFVAELVNIYFKSKQ